MQNQQTNNSIPSHVAIIMDGNGRWAKVRGKKRTYGHAKGTETVQMVVETAVETEIKYLTLYTFSTENWDRPAQEVETLMTLLARTCVEKERLFHEHNIRLLTIGNTSKLPQETKNNVEKLKEITKNNTGLTLVLALNYGGREDIVRATKNIALQVKNGTISVDDINQQIFLKNLTSSEIPDPDFLIRTAGEKRISNFLLWEISYSELYFTKQFWPEFSKNDFLEAIEEYKKRSRRFGLVNE